MEPNYEKLALEFKALSDANRLMILEMLTCGELCGCELLEKLHITQPTLSYHMNILKEADIVSSRKVGKNTYYQLNLDMYDSMANFFERKDKENCLCN